MKSLAKCLLAGTVLAVCSLHLACGRIESRADKSNLDHKRPPDAEWKAAYLVRDPDTLANMSKSKNEYILVLVAKNPRTPARALEEIASSGLYFDPFLCSSDTEDDRDVIFALFENPALPGSVIAMIEKQFPRRWCPLQDHPNTPPDVLMRKLTRFADPSDDDHWIATDPEYKDYLKVKELSATPIEALKFMAGSKLNPLREEAALSAFTPEGTLVELSKDRYEVVREKLARNPSLPVTIMKKLASDPVKDVRHALAMNVACPRDLLDQLAQDKEEYVRDEASETLYYMYGVPRDDNARAKKTSKGKKLSGH